MVSRGWWVLCISALCLVLASCDDAGDADVQVDGDADSDSDSDVDSDADGIVDSDVAADADDDEVEDEPIPLAFGPMAEEVSLWVWNNGYESGDWAPDWDDAPFYGPAFYASWGWESGHTSLQRRAREARDLNLANAEAGLDDLLGVFLENASAIIYGTLGVIEYMAASGDRERIDVVDNVIAQADSFLALMGNYVNEEMFENYATDTYGPTSITAIFALLLLQHAVLLDTETSAGYVERARAILERVDEVAWNGSFYQFNTENVDDIYLYPNVAMMIASVRMNQATGEAAYLERAEDVYQAIQVMKYEDRPGYFSPYSALTMGAETDDYTTLSSTNYTLLALALLNEETGQQVYRDEIDELVGFVEEYLWLEGEGQIIHHWMDGRQAVPEDPEYYCIGCNLQLLYILWWVNNTLG